MCAESRIRDTFDRLASEYDELKLRVIPGYGQVQDLALRYANANSSERVLELGCGTAEWASAFLLGHPTANYVGVEFSPKMRDLASSRLASHGTRVQLLDQDLNASVPGGPFDLVVSFFAIHHVEDKQRLIEEVFASLRRVACSSMRTSRSRPIRPSSERSKRDGAHSCSERASTLSEFRTCWRTIATMTSRSRRRRSWRTCERPALRLQRSSGVGRSLRSFTAPNRYRACHRNSARRAVCWRATRIGLSITGNANLGGPKTRVKPAAAPRSVEHAAPGAPVRRTPARPRPP